jgi:hypothetical protein
MSDTRTERRPTAGVTVTMRIVETMRVLIVAGVVAGALMVGVGSRLAMLLLRVTSPDRVVGVESDDGFTIGRVTVGGTYNLLLIGAAVGIIGAGVYRLVSPWLIGPVWFHRATTGLAAAAVGGAMLVHADGIDFTLLQPTWLAIGLFVALPAMFGTFIGPAVDAVARPDSWTARGWRRWLLPIVCIACFPPSILLLVFITPVVLILVVAGEIDPVQRVRRSLVYSLAVRATWLTIAVLGLVGIIGDVRALG